MKIFFTSDTHFYESGEKLKIMNSVLIRDRRPFKSIGQMNKTIIKNFNKQAKKDDVIFFVGDFCDYSSKNTTSWEQGFNLVKKIKAKVILILGNNERRVMENHFNNNFDEFKEYLLNLGFFEVYKKSCITKINGLEVFLTHKPLDCNPNYFNLFGHIHRNGTIKRFGFNVGVDNNEYKLFTVEDVLCIKYQMDNFCDENVYCSDLPKKKENKKLKET